MTFLKQVPMPMSGLALGLLSLGNLFLSLNIFSLWLFCGLLGSTLLLVLLAKLLFTPLSSFNQLKNPLVLAVSPTFTMAVMVGTTYLTHSKSLSFLAGPLWFLAYGLQVILVLAFLYHVLLRAPLAWSNVFPSWFIIFVGLGVAPVTGGEISPNLSLLALGSSFLFFLVFLPIVLYRLIKIKGFTEATRPLIAITCAPASLLLTGYLALGLPTQTVLLLGWLIVAQGLYLFVLCQLRNLIPKTFYPTWAALTFPFVISATALNSALHHLPAKLALILTPLATLETLIATLMVSLALYHYSRFLLKALH